MLSTENQGSTDAGTAGEEGLIPITFSRGTRRVTVSYPDMDYIGFWHATLTEAPYVCIEPWSSLPSRQDIVEDLSTQPGLKSLKAGGVYRNSWSIEIH